MVLWLLLVCYRSAVPDTVVVAKLGLQAGLGLHHARRVRMLSVPQRATRRLAGGSYACPSTSSPCLQGTALLPAWIVLCWSCMVLSWLYLHLCLHLCCVPASLSVCLHCLLCWHRAAYWEGVTCTLWQADAPGVWCSVRLLSLKGSLVRWLSVHFLACNVVYEWPSLFCCAQFC